eukprot:7887220-Pyramimonas_sp.AAC.1
MTLTSSWTRPEKDSGTLGPLRFERAKRARARNCVPSLEPKRPGAVRRASTRRRHRRRRSRRRL